MNERIKEYIYSHKDDMLSDLERLVAIPSVKGEAKDGAPFGAGPRRALDEALKMCEGSGFEVKNHKNAVGTAELKAGEDTALGILCHLDVVPAYAEGWSSDPFTVTQRDGRLYGRGVIDDKGPFIASLYAMKCVKELGLPLRRGVSLVFGTDEENGSADLEMFLKDEKLPENVFTPDGSFPVINIEKGMLRTYFSGSFDGGSVLSFTGGSIPNAVPDRAECTLEGVSPSGFEQAAEKVNADVTFETEYNSGILTIRCRGRAAHASTPEGGANAVTALIALLCRMPLAVCRQTDILYGLADKFPCGQTDGENIGLKLSDDNSGALTCVLSIFNMNGSECSGCIDVRFPTCTTLANVRNKELCALKEIGLDISGDMGDEPHCVDGDSDFVRTLLSVYEEVEGEKGRCIAIGGGTYVHNIGGGVAFGAERGDTDYHMHGADEFITIDELLRDAVLFAEAIIAVCG